MRRTRASPGSLTTVAVVGNLNLDIKTSRIRSTAPLFEDGETSVQEITESTGGGGANTAVAAALMGARVHFCSCVGDDELGRRLLRHLRTLGVVSHVRTVPVATGRSLALSWDNGHRHFLSSLPNVKHLEAGAIDVPALARVGCRHLYRADIWFSEQMLFGGNAALLAACRSAGMETSLDINWDPGWGEGIPGRQVRARIEAVRAVLPAVTFVHGNERELMRFCGSPSIDHAAHSLVAWGARTVIVHRGERGCAAFSGGAWVQSPPAKVHRIVSDTGSGDVFSAAFLVHGSLPLGRRLREAGRAAARHLQGTPSYLPPMERRA